MLNRDAVFAHASGNMAAMQRKTAPKHNKPAAWLPYCTMHKPAKTARFRFNIMRIMDSGKRQRKACPGQKACPVRLKVTVITSVASKRSVATERAQRAVRASAASGQSERSERSERAQRAVRASASGYGREGGHSLLLCVSVSRCGGRVSHQFVGRLCRFSLIPSGLLGRIPSSGSMSVIRPCYLTGGGGQRPALSPFLGLSRPKE